MFCVRLGHVSDVLENWLLREKFCGIHTMPVKYFSVDTSCLLVELMLIIRSRNRASRMVFA